MEAVLEGVRRLCLVRWSLQQVRLWCLMIELGKENLRGERDVYKRGIERVKMGFIPRYIPGISLYQ